MTGEIILITGANKGLGFESARQLGKLGYRILLGARDAALGATAVSTLSAEGVDVHFVSIDVTSEDSVVAAVKDVESRFGKVDVLINNAGVLKSTADPTSTDLAPLRTDMEVNYFGLIRATTHFLPLLRKAAVPRIVNLSSILGSHGSHADPSSMIYGYTVAGYNASKSAVNMYTQNLAFVLQKENAAFKVNAAHPGWVKTDLGGESAPLEITEGVETTVFLATIGADGPTGGFFYKKDRLPW